MSGIQLSGLISGSFNWQSVVDQLIQIDSAPVAALQASEATNNNQLAAFAQLSTDLTSVKASAQALQADGVFNAVSAASTTAGSTWNPQAAKGTAAGNYTIAVTHLATAASRLGASDLAAGLNATSDVSGLTLATLPTSTAVTAGIFTVDGQQVNVALTDSLQQVFDKIAAATGGNVTGGYDPVADKVTLASGDGSEVVLGAANDTSNFFSAMRLVNTGLSATASTSRLGAAAVNAPLASSRLNAPFTGLDASGNGTFSVNGVAIAYNVNTDSLSTVLGRINGSAAGVSASYDASGDRVILSNTATGDTGIGAADVSGNLLAALGLTSGSTLSRGQNAVFSVNGGGPITSASNNLDPDTLGIPGLTVGINSETTQTVSVVPDATAMNTSIQNFITSYNTLVSDLDNVTQITPGINGTVQTSTLSGNQEVPQWAENLRSLAFGAISGLSGTIKSLDDLGIGFTGISPTLSVTDATKLNTALSTNPAAVGAFFSTPGTGFAAQFINYTSKLLLPTTGEVAIETDTLNTQNAKYADKITALQAQLANERTHLTNEFLAMQSAQSAAQQQQQILNGMFGGSSTSTSTAAPATTTVSSSSG